MWPRLSNNMSPIDANACIRTVLPFVSLSIDNKWAIYHVDNNCNFEHNEITGYKHALRFPLYDRDTLHWPDRILPWYIVPKQRGTYIRVIDRYYD